LIKRIERGDGTRFQVYGKRDGRKIYVGTYDSRREAAAADENHRVTQRKIDAGELPPEHDEKRTLEDAVDAWLKSLEASGSRSHGNYDERMSAYVLPKLGATPIVSLRKAHVMKWRDDMATRFAPNTVNGNLTCLSSAFSYFVDQEWVETNPCHGVAQIEGKDSAIFTWIRTREEITKLLVECPKGIRELVTVAVCTGMRLDEIVHLRWADIDLERRLIAVHRGRHGTTKSGKARHVPILDALLPFLRELALKRGGAVLVFPGRNGKPRSKPGVRVPFKQAAKRVGLDVALRFHDLRHTFASHWVLDGGDIFRLSKILGHSSVVVTQKVYAHLAPEAWEQDYHRLAFTLPSEGTVYGLTKRKQAAAAAPAGLTAQSVAS
jgi:integrase